MKFRALKTKKNRHCNIGLLFLASIITFIIISPAHAATYNYYFSTSGGGSTCSEKSPCAKVSDAQTKVNGAGSSDIVNLYFNRGDIWSFNTAAATKTLCFGIFVGSNGPTVNIDAYGTGNKPVFDGLVSNFSTVPSHNTVTGPLFYNRIFEFRRANCSVKNIEIRRVYGVGILLRDAGETGFTLKYCEINNFGDCAIVVRNGSTNVSVEYNKIYTGQELIRYRKRSGWGGAIQIAVETPTSYAPSGNTVRYNLVYDIAGEGINAGNSIIEYNVVGNTAASAIQITPHEWNAGQSIVRYNYMIMADWSTHDYDTTLSNAPPNGGGKPIGTRVFDETVGHGSNINCDIQIYGNIIINHAIGIWIFNSQGGETDKFGPVKVYNNTIIDSHVANIRAYNLSQFTDIKIYNNASILYDRTGARHVDDDSTSYPNGWDIDNNAFWTSGGSPTVDSDWRTNCVTSDPKLPGEEVYHIDWDGQTGATYWKNITINKHLFPPSNSSLFNSGKTLSGYEATFLTYGSDFTKLPGTATFVTSKQPDAGKWDIGAISRGGVTSIIQSQIIPLKPINLYIKSIK